MDGQVTGDVALSQVITALYARLLQRTPDAPGLDDKLARVRSGDLTMDGLIDEFIDSEEFRSRLPGLIGLEHSSEATAESPPPGVPGFVEPEQAVAHLYRALLEREPETQALADKGRALEGGVFTLEDLAGELIGSTEFEEQWIRRQRDRGDRAVMDVEPVVDGVYAALLGRPADPLGMRYGIERLSTGTLSVKDFIAELLGSDEFYDKLPGLMNQYGGGMRPFAAKLEDIVRSLYATLLDRAPDERRLQRKLRDLASHDLYFEDVVGEILASREFLSKLPDLLRRFGAKAGDQVASYAAVVNAIYAAVFDREPDEEGLEAKLLGLSRSDLTLEDVIRELIASDEFAARRGDRPRVEGASRAEPSAIVGDLYRALLGREPDQEGLMLKRAGLETGELSLEDVAGELIGSDEFYDKLPGVLARYGVDGGRHVVSYATVVRALYLALLDREPDAVGFDSKIERLIERRLELEDVAGELLGSDEFFDKLPALLRRVGAGGGRRVAEYSHFVTALYRALLDREPDQVGFDSKIERLAEGRLELEDVAGELLGSDEFFDTLPALLRRVGAGGARHVAEHGAFVTSLYKAILDRAPDAAGFESKIERLAEDRIELEDVAGELLGSDEFYEKLPALLRRYDASGARYVIDYGSVVRALYHALLDREPDEVGFDSRVSRLGRGEMALEDLAGELLGSDEFYEHLPALLNRTSASASRYVADVASVVGALYGVLLGRPPEPDGLASKMDRLAAGTLSLEDLVKEITASEEYRDRLPAVLREGGVVANPRFTNDVSQYGEILMVLTDMVRRASWSHYVIDVGARGRERSNSYDLMRHFGWKGLLVEANPHLVDSIRADFEGLDYELASCAVSDFNGTATLNVGANDDVSSLIEIAAARWGEVREQIEVEVRRLPDLLEARGAPLSFDLLSIDIEGEDVRVLNDLIDGSHYRPTWVIIEVSTEADPTDLSAFGLSDSVCELYEILGQTHSNLLLRRKDVEFGPERLVHGLYAGLLQRPADADGLTEKSRRLAEGRMSIEDLIGEFVGSDEFLAALPKLIHRYNADPDRYVTPIADVVDALYTTLLARPADPEGHRSKVRRLFNHEMNVEDVVGELVGSDEFLGALPELINRYNADPDRFVTPIGTLIDAIYSVLLRRPADPEGHRSKVRRLLAKEMEVEDVVGELVGSDEFLAALPELINQYHADPARYVLPVADLVDALYAVLLRRPADEGALRDKISRLRAQEIDVRDIVRELIESEEFAETAAARRPAAPPTPRPSRRRKH